MSGKLTASLTAAAVVVPICCVIAPLVLLASVINTCPRSASAATVDDTTQTAWDPDQRANAATIITVGIEKTVPRRGWIIAVATAIQESRLRNLGHLGARNDHDSLGLFQQRPSQGWGTPEQILQPRYAAAKFYDKLLGVPGWRAMPLTQAAQAVQASAYPDAYGKHEATAARLVDQIASAAADCLTPPGSWVMPVSGTLTSGFRPPDRPAHDGIDLAAARGTPVVAAAAGTVITVACNASLGGSPYPCDQDGAVNVLGCGWYLDIQHSANLVTRYCHLRHRPSPAVGSTVLPGQPIGLVGASGNSSGPTCTSRSTSDAQQPGPTPSTRHATFQDSPRQDSHDTHEHRRPASDTPTRVNRTDDFQDQVQRRISGDSPARRSSGDHILPRHRAGRPHRTNRDGRAGHCLGRLHRQLDRTTPSLSGPPRRPARQLVNCGRPRRLPGVGGRQGLKERDMDLATITQALDALYQRAPHLPRRPDLAQAVLDAYREDLPESAWHLTGVVAALWPIGAAAGAERDDPAGHPPRSCRRLHRHSRGGTRL